MDLRLLVVDDNEADRTLFKYYLKTASRNLTVFEAASAEEGLNLIKADNHYDCVFLDYMLPDMDGISLLRRVYDENKDLGPFPVVILTGQGSESVAIDAIRYGAQDYLIKDNISKDTLQIALAKARQVFDLKKTATSQNRFLSGPAKCKPSAA